MARANLENKLMNMANNYTKEPEKPVMNEPEPEPEARKEEPVAVNKPVRTETTEKRGKGRPRLSPKKCFSVYVEEEKIELLDLAARLYGCKTPQEYMTLVITKDLENKKDKLEEFNKKVEEIKAF